MSVRDFLFATALLCLSALAGKAFAKQPDFPAPPKAEVSHVGDEMVINGRRTQVRMFTSPHEIDDVLGFYRELWEDPVARGGPGFAAEDVALKPWRLLTRVEDGYVMTVQVREGDPGSFGYLAVSRLPEGGEAEATPTPPTMRGSEILSDIMHDDPGKQGQTTVVKNKFSVVANVEFYRTKYGSWRADMDRAIADGRVHAFRFVHGRQSVNITINGNDSESEVVINRVKRSLM